MTGPGDSGRDLGLEQKLREGEGQSAWSPRLCPGLPGSHSSSVGSEVRATPILYGFFPGGVHEAPREHMQLHRPLAWAEVDAPCFACLVRGPGCRPQPAVVLVFLQPLSQPESPAPGPPGRMDLEPPPQPDPYYFGARSLGISASVPSIFGGSLLQVTCCPDFIILLKKIDN